MKLLRFSVYCHITRFPVLTFCSPRRLHLISPHNCFSSSVKNFRFSSTQNPHDFHRMKSPHACGVTSNNDNDDNAGGGGGTVVESLTFPWLDPLELQQRLRSIMVQVVLLSSPFAPLTISDLVALLQQPFQSVPSVFPYSSLVSSPSFSTSPDPECFRSPSFYVLDPLTRSSFAAASEAVRLYQAQSQQEEKHASRYSSSVLFSAIADTTSSPPTSSCPTSAPKSSCPHPSVQEQERRYLDEARRRISPSRWYAVGKKCVQHYDQSVLTLMKLEMRGQLEEEKKKQREGDVGQQSTEKKDMGSKWIVSHSIPQVNDVLVWMTVGLCLSDPFFRLISSPLVSSGEPPPPSSSSSGSCSFFSSHAIVYPLPSSQLLFTWDFDYFWLAAKSKWKRLKKNALQGREKRLLRQQDELSSPVLEEDEKKHPDVEEEYRKRREKEGVKEEGESDFHFSTLPLNQNNVILRPVVQIQYALQLYYSTRSSVSPHAALLHSWTYFHSLYYLTCHSSVWSFSCPLRLRGARHQKQEGGGDQEKGRGGDSYFRVFHPSHCGVSARFFSEKKNQALQMAGAQEKNPSSVLLTEEKGSNKNKAFPPEKTNHKEDAIDKEYEEKEEDARQEWEALFVTWFELLDHNLPDHLGDHTIVLEKRRNCRQQRDHSPSALQHFQGNNDGDGPAETYQRWYREMPHVGFNEHLYGPPRLRQFISSGLSCAVDGGNAGATHRTPFSSMSNISAPSSSASSFSALSGDAGSFRYLLHLFFVQKKYHQTSAGGGFYYALQRLNERFVQELAAYFFLAPMSVSRLAGVLQWYHSNGVANTEVTLLFREYSFFYFLLWIGGNPFLHRQHQRQVESATALDQVRMACSGASRSGGSRRHPNNNNSNTSMDDGVAKEEDWMEEEIKEEGEYLHLLYHKANVFTPPVTIELLAFFVLKDGVEKNNSNTNDQEKGSVKDNPPIDERKVRTGGGGEGKAQRCDPSAFMNSEASPPILLESIRGIKLNTLYVVNTSYATPMEIWEALGHIKFPVSTSASASSFSSSCVNTWSRIEPFLWCAPYSLLKRRLSRVAQSFVEYADDHPPHHRSLQPHSCLSENEREVLLPASFSNAHRKHTERGVAASPPPAACSSSSCVSITIKKWAEVLLWEVDWGGRTESDRFSVACEMLWSLLALADPHEQHFQLTPPPSCTSPSSCKNSCRRTESSFAYYSNNSASIGDWIVTFVAKKE